MRDIMLRNEIIGEVRRAMAEVKEQMEERWLTPEELSKQFAFFTKDWIRHYGHLLPRERVEFVGAVSATTHWGYPLHKINRMVAEGAFRTMEYREAMKQHGGGTAMHQRGKGKRPAADATDTVAKDGLNGEAAERQKREGERTAADATDTVANKVVMDGRKSGKTESQRGEGKRIS